MAYGVSTRAKESTAAGIQIAGAAAAVPTNAAAVAALLVKAGVASSAVPVVGWVVAAGTAIAASVITLVSTIKQRRLRESQAIEVARQLGIPAAASVPEWIFDALAMGPNARQLEARRLEEKLKKGGTLRDPIWDIRTKLTILGVLELLDMAAKRAAAGLTPYPPTPEFIKAVQGRADRIESNAKLVQGIYWGVAGTLLGLFAIFMFTD